MKRMRSFSQLKGDRFNSLRRHLAMLGDRAFVLLRHRLLPSPVVEPFDGNPRFALITVNSSTTRFLKLMLLTLSEQRALSLVPRLIVVDNDSGDGGLPFIRRLASCIPRVHLLENRRFPTYARGMRLGIALPDDLEADTPAPARQSAPVLRCGHHLSQRGYPVRSCPDHRRHPYGLRRRTLPR